MQAALTRYQLAEFGALLAEPARAAILLALLEGRARPAGELAAIAGVGAATASAHLRKLTDAGLLAVILQGRHRYYRLAGEDVAHWLESLAFAEWRPQRRIATADPALARARTCYRHLAGRLGVTLFDRLGEIRGLDLDSSAVRLNAAGADLLGAAGLAGTGALTQLAGRTCVDWTERRFHLSGALGNAIARSLVDQGWLRRREASRALDVTGAGRAGLRALGIEE